MIRSETSDDITGISKVLTSAFNQEAESLLVQELRATRDFITDFSFVMEVENQLVGYLLLYPVDIKNVHNTVKSLALAPMAVIPVKQRQGYGGELVNHALSCAAKDQWGSVIVLGHPGYYPKFGFQPASNWGVTCPFKVPEEVFMAIELIPGSLEQGGSVIYPEPYMKF